MTGAWPSRGAADGRRPPRIPAIVDGDLTPTQLARLAAEQHGAVHRDQLLASGRSEDWITRNLDDILHEVATSVYAYGHPRLSRRGRGIAALLHAGPGSALSYESAARLWEIAEYDGRGPIHVSVPDRRALVTASGTKLHRPRGLTPDQITERNGLRVTTIERTITDLLPDLETPQIVRLLEQIVTVHNRSPDLLHEWADDLGRTVGKAKLLEALDSVVGPVVIRSRLEEEFRILCSAAGLPMPETNVRLGRWEGDALWRKQRLVVELDGWRFHGGHWQFQRDREKGLALAEMGYEVIRLTWRQVVRDRETVAGVLHSVIARRAITAL